MLLTHFKATLFFYGNRARRSSILIKARWQCVVFFSGQVQRKRKRERKGGWERTVVPLALHFGRPRLFILRGVINGRYPTGVGVGSGGIYSLAIMASANETSVYYGGGETRERIIVAALLRSRQRWAQLLR